VFEICSVYTRLELRKRIQVSPDMPSLGEKQQCGSRSVDPACLLLSVFTSKPSGYSSLGYVLEAYKYIADATLPENI
jgi:hypothetical protein